MVICALLVAVGSWVSSGGVGARARRRAERAWTTRLRPAKMVSKVAGLAWARLMILIIPPVCYNSAMTKQQIFGLVVAGAVVAAVGVYAVSEWPAKQEERIAID